MGGGLENARWPLHFSGRGVKYHNANAKALWASRLWQGQVQWLGSNRNANPSLAGWGKLGVVFILIDIFGGIKN